MPNSVRFDRPPGRGGPPPDSRLRSHKLKLIEDAYVELMVAKFTGHAYKMQDGRGWFDDDRERTFSEIAAHGRERLRATDELTIMHGLTVEYGKTDRYSLHPPDEEILTLPLHPLFSCFGRMEEREEGEGLTSYFLKDPRGNPPAVSPPTQPDPSVFNPDYKPPKTIDELLKALFNLWAYYKVVWFFGPGDSEAVLDLSLSKLVGMIREKAAIELTRDKGKMPKTKSMTKTKRDKSFKPHVIHAYHDLTKREEIPFHANKKGLVNKQKLVNKIQSELGSKWQYVPSTTSILRWLKEKKLV